MRRSFQEAWPELARGLHRSLRYHGAGPEEADDIVQETALRLFRIWDDVDETRSPRGLAFTIAWNLLRDERRKHSKLHVADRVPDEVRDDVERAGLARLELGRVFGAIAALDITYRSALLEEIAPFPTTRRASGALRMVRMRARKRLASLLEAASGFTVHLGVKWRRTLAVSQEIARVSAPVAGGSVAALGTAFIFSFLGTPYEGEAEDRGRIPMTRPPLSSSSVDVLTVASGLDRSALVEAATDGPAWTASDPGMHSGATDDPSAQGQNVRFGVGEEDGPRAGGSVTISPGSISSIPHCGVRLQTRALVGVDCSADVAGHRIRTGVTLEPHEG